MGVISQFQGQLVSKKLERTFKVIEGILGIVEPVAGVSDLQSVVPKLMGLPAANAFT